MYARRVTRPKPLKSQTKKWSAPIGGWVSNTALAYGSQPGAPQGAAILDNFFPTSSVVRLRRGKDLHATLPSDVMAIFSYKNGSLEKLFAATQSVIYDVTTTPAGLASGFMSGDWTFVQFATTGGVYLVGVNGADPGRLYDGTVLTGLSITFSGGKTTADMSHVWVYKNRLWFAERDSLTAWYLAPDSIAGVATPFPMGGVFGKGGSLLFGQTWSLDSGAEGGLSEQNIFCSTEGEVAIYQGGDPASASDWNKVGVYRIGTPLGKNAFIRGGGDLAIATSVGLVPLSKAITLDVTSLNVATISYNIADAWSDAIKFRGLEGWCCEIWPEQKMAFVSPPDVVGGNDPVVFVSNTETGAWCRFTNWRVLCTEVFQGRLYFGSTGGAIYLANQGGQDDGALYTGVCMPLFEDMGSPGALKIGKLGRTTTRSLAPVNGLTTLQVNYDLNVGSAPDAGTGGQDLWGTALWGSSTWGSINPEYLQEGWQSLGGAGDTLALAYQVSSGSTAPLDTELISQQITYTTATLVS